METINEIFGLHVHTLTTCQMLIRATTVFFAALAFIRIAGIRTLGKQNAFDQLTLLMLGAIMGRAVVAAEQPFFPSMLAVLLIMLLHRLLARLTFISKTMGKLFKGEPVMLFEHGKPNAENMKKVCITHDDLVENLHLFLNEDDTAKMKSAYLERSGEISIIKKEQ